MIVIEDRFADVVITDEEVDQLEVVGDLIRHIENADHERATTLHRRGDDDAEQHKQAKDMAPVLPLEIIYRDANSHPPDATVSAPTRTSSLFGPMIRGLFLPVIAISRRSVLLGLALHRWCRQPRLKMIERLAIVSTGRNRLFQVPVPP